MEGFADWDLLAVVRSCCTATATATATTTSAMDVHPSPPPPPPVKEEPCFHLPTPTPTPPSSSSSSSTELLFAFPTALFDPPTASFFGGQQDLQDVCKPKSICTTNSTNFQSLPSSASSSSLTSSVSSSSSSSSVIAGKSFEIGEQPELRRLIHRSQVVFGAAPAATSPAQRTKKRKNLVKKVFHVPAEGLSNDMWAWRKYGQKPIKGSPYPRGYYRCSSSKGCLARKQVERNRSDPKMFIVTYTAEHNHPVPTHRNSLAGSTRQKPNAAAAASADVPSQDQPTCSSPSAASLSPPTEKSESKTEGDDLIKEDENNDMGLSDLMLNDDFYVGFEKIDADECFSDHFSPPMEAPWLANSSSTATAAGGS